MVKVKPSKSLKNILKIHDSEPPKYFEPVLNVNPSQKNSLKKLLVLR